MSIKEIQRKRKPILTEGEGRPSKKTPPKKKRNLYLSDPQYKALVTKAEENGQDFSSFVRGFLIKQDLIPSK